MAEGTPIPIASRLFEIAELFVVLRCRAELYWTDDQHDPHEGAAALQPLGTAVRKLTTAARAAATVLDQVPAAGRLVAFAEAVERFWAHFIVAWPGQTRSDKLKKVIDVDPELAYDRELYMHRGSPLDMHQCPPLPDGHWGHVQVAADHFLAALEPELRECFAVSALLGSEMWPTFTGGQRTRGADREPNQELAYLTLDFADEVRQAVRRLADHYPALSRIGVDFGNASVFRTMQQINALWKLIGSLLRDPGGAPGYLGLVLDRKGGYVSRHGVRRPLTRKLLWEVLIRLERGGDEWSSRKALALAWHDAEIGPSDATMSTALTDLRKKTLEPLGVTIELKRELGWKLQDVDGPPEEDA